MQDADWLTDAQARAWRGYRQMRARLDLQIARDLAADAGLSDADYDVLSNVSEAQGGRLRIRDLAAAMLWTQSRLSHHLTRMQQRGLVRREADPSDGRGAVVVLTPAGRRKIAAAAPAHVASVRHNFIDVLSPSQLAVLTQITDAVVAQLDLR